MTRRNNEIIIADRTRGMVVSVRSDRTAIAVDNTAEALATAGFVFFGLALLAALLER